MLDRAAWMTVCPVRVGLSEPDPFRRERQEAGAIVVHVALEFLGLAQGGGDEGIDHRDREIAKKDRGKGRHGDQPQRGNPGGAHHHEFAGARQLEKQREAREHQYEREDLVERLGHTKGGEAQDVAKFGIRSGVAAQIIHTGKQCNDERQDGEDTEKGPDEPHEQVARKRHGCTPFRTPQGWER